MSEPIYSPGLEGVIAGETAISTIAGGLQYRGYSIEDLAEHATFEEVAYLLLHGELPTAERAGGASASGWPQAPRSPPPIIDLLRKIPAGVPMMDVMRTGASPLAHWDPDTADNSHDANLRKAERLLAQLPIVMAARHRLAKGKKPVAYDPKLSLAGNILWMLFEQAADRAADQGDGRVADPVRRARVQRLDLHGPRRQLDALRPALGRSPPRSARSRARCTAGPTRR